ncbi:ABC transporter substrate-binding protein [Candidatus Roizmanbacteria bacterium]|nr:ABC transporter substrate-binding protein [Candidatus Roizmanbacteria bacterium]
MSGFIIGFLFSLFLVKFYPALKVVFAPNTKSIGIVGRYNLKSLPLSVQRLISIGLTQVSSDGLALPSLSESWESTNSGKVYIFHLKNNLIWHDGQALKARDIQYSIKGITTTPVDEKNLKITLKEPFSPLPIVLSRPVFRQNLVGLGHYKVSDIKLKEEDILSLKLTPADEKLPTLKYKFYATLDEAILAFKLGEIDILEDLPTKDPFTNWKNVTIREITLYDRFLGLFFNTQDDILKDKEIRQGLSFAIPSFAPNDRVYTPISPSSWAYYNKVRIYKPDLENAQKILEDSALSTKSAEIKISTYAFYLPIAQKIANAWNSIGINTKIKVEPGFPNQYQAILLAQEIPPDPDQYQFWHSTAIGTNISKYSSLKIDKLLEDGRKDTDLETRKKIYADFQRYLVDDAPVAFLFFPKVYTIERK